MDDVVYRPLDAVAVYAVRGRAPGPHLVGPVVGRLIERLDAALAEAGRPTVPPGVFWYRQDEDGLEVHVSYRAEDPPVPGDGYEVVELPAVPLAATVLLRGDLSGIGDAWAALMRRAEADGHRFGEPTREVYLVAEGHTPAADWVTELQLPVDP